MAGRRILPASDTYFDGAPVSGRLYQTDENGLLIPVQGASTADATIPDGYVVTRDAASQLWVAKALPISLPPGGTTGQVLTKVSDDDFDADWEDPTGGGGGDGTSTGTPGDLPGIPIYTGLGLTIDPVLEGTVEHFEHKITSRKYHNWTNIGAVRLQAVIINAISGGKLALQVSVNSGSFWQFPNAAGSGPWVSTAATGYPVPGDFFTVDAGVKVNNVLQRLVTIMPSGVVVPFKHGVVWLDVVSSAAPPATDTPVPGAPPEGAGTWGDLITDLNANSLSQGNATRITAWNDDSGNAKHGTTDSGSQGMEYHDSGFGGGPAPMAQSKGTNYGQKVPSSHGGNDTHYLLTANVNGAGTGGTGDSSVLLHMPGGPGENMGLLKMNDGHFYMWAGGSAFGTPQGISTNTYPDNTVLHLRVLHVPGAGSARLFVNGVLEIALGDALIVNGWNGGVIYIGENSGFSQPDGTMDMHRYCRYNSSNNDSTFHGTVGQNLVEDSMDAAAGL